MGVVESEEPCDEDPVCDGVPVLVSVFDGEFVLLGVFEGVAERVAVRDGVPD